MTRLLAIAGLALSAFACATTAPAPVRAPRPKSMLLGGIKPGPYAVGVRKTQSANTTREWVTVTTWYPTPESFKPIHFRDYLGPSRKEFEEFLKSTGIPDEAIARWVDARMLATIEAAPKPGRWPVVLLVQGNGQADFDQAVLAELIASHGFVVATVPSVTRLQREMKTDRDIGAMAEIEANNLAAALKGTAVMNGDTTCIGLVGHSFGARGALFFATNHNEARALVSLDGGIGTSAARSFFERSTMFRTGSASHLAILHLYETQDTFLQQDLSFIQSLNARKLETVLIPSMRHVHFTTTGFAAAAIPELLTVTKGDAGTAAGMATLAEKTVAFQKKELSGCAR